MENSSGSDLPEGAASEQSGTPAQSDMSELMKAHLDEVAGGLAAHSSWYSYPP